MHEFDVMMVMFSVIICMILSLNMWVVECIFMALGFIYLFMNFFISFEFMFSGMVYFFDFVSSSLSILSFWVFFLSTISMVKIYKKNTFSYNFLFMNILLLMCLLVSFSASSFLVFYLFFEFSLFPMLVIIMGWGYQPERMQAGMYMFLYTVMASLPLLAVSLGVCSELKILSFNYYVVNLGYFSDFMMMSSLVLFMFAFMVKLPIYFVHLWLPKAHVEAPVSGSMILAGVLLKLGGYGLFRILVMFYKTLTKISWFWVSMGLIGGCLVSVLSLRQVDMKSLIAYSSVAHMSLVLAGFLSLSVVGFKGAMMLMIGHGLCSSGMFFIANLSYEGSGSRLMHLNKGMLNILPSASIFWFVLSMGNMAAPLTINLFSEIMIITCMFGFAKSCLFMMSWMCFFSAGYSLYLYISTNHGMIGLLKSFGSFSLVDLLILFLHIFPLNFMFFIGYFF
uniref:NADH-ubiquinone oxidoreductase chain 4 n=1 Tax=Dimorphostylis asiatica TaxID=2840398 RepID=A0A8F8AFG8_9CRUS|nr:NADH dehydrogenase subunit 4 [Dimorphostylis asiatica]